MTNVQLGRGAMLAALVAGSIACSNGEPEVKVAPTAEKLAPAAPKSVAASAFTVTKVGSKIDFTMDAPLETILGKVRDAAGGELQIDTADLTKTTGLVSVDISGLELFQRTREKEGEALGAETKQDKQNEHARAWLELDEGEGADEARKQQVRVNRTVQFSIKSVKTDTPDVSKLTGNERRVRATVTGEFLLHGHKTERTAEVELTFKIGPGGKPIAIALKTTKPFAVGLAEHDVRPRDTIGKLLAKGLDALSPKVAKDAMVAIELSLAPAAERATKGAAPYPTP